MFFIFQCFQFFDFLLFFPFSFYLSLFHLFACCFSSCCCCAPWPLCPDRGCPFHFSSLILQFFILHVFMCFFFLFFFLFFFCFLIFPFLFFLRHCFSFFFFSCISFLYVSLLASVSEFVSSVAGAPWKCGVLNTEAQNAPHQQLATHVVRHK